MNNREHNILLRNNTGNKPKQDLIESFVIRKVTFESILLDIRGIKKTKNHLVIGQRGSGKTTLLHRIKYAIEDDLKMHTDIIPIMFSEEQYNLMEVVNLWESIAEHLEDYLEFKDLSQKILDIELTKNHENEAYIILEKTLIANNKKIIVFIENIDAFFKKIGKNGQERLFEVLNKNNNISIICSSTTYFDGISKSTDPFYGFFKITELGGLSIEESINLLNKLAEQKKQTQQIEIIIEKHPKRLESLRRLTGGNPRIISYLFQIFLDNENGKAISDLYILLDDLTFLYKAELDQLSAQQQKIIDAMAKNWDAISTKELSQKTNIDSKNISAILNNLEKNQIIESIQTKTKNNLYRLKDRFLNIWYLMRFGKKRDKENIIWLVRFFDAWFDKNELLMRIDSHITNLKSGKYNEIAALDMGNVFLSCENVSNEVKYNLYQTTKSLLSGKLTKQLMVSDDLLDESIRKLVKQQEWDQAIEVLKEIKSKEKQLALAGWVHLNKGNVQKSAEILEELYTIKPVGELATLLAEISKILNLFDKTIFYYEESIKYEIWDSYYKLGNLYANQIDNIIEAEKNYQFAINHNIEEATIALAEIFYKTNRLQESENLISSAIKQGQKNIKNKLAKIFTKQNKITEAISIYKEVVEDGDKTALVNLGKLYLSKENPDIKEAKKVLLEAITNGQKSAYQPIAQIYLKEENPDTAIKYLEKGIELKDAESAHLLAHICHLRSDWKKTEQLFLKSIAWGRLSSLVCLANATIYGKRKERKNFILNQFEKKYIEIQRKPILFIVYARILLWDNQFEKSLKILKNVSERLTITLKSNASEEYKEDIIDELTIYFMVLMSKDQLKIAFELFLDNDTNYKQILKPVYYSLMNLMKNENPNEYLKAGNELKETVQEINKTIEKYKTIYK